MRLLLLPLGNKHALLHCQQLLTPKVRRQPRFDDKLVAWVERTWTNFKTAKSPWKRTVTKYTQKLLDSVPLEEHSMRSIPPQNAWMRKSKSGVDRHHVAPRDVVPTALEPIALTYPQNCPMFPNNESAIKYLHNAAINGCQYHTRMIAICLLGIPLTLPLALNPFLPNIPGIYLAYRTWCHWKALLGSRHLRSLVKQNHLQPQPLVSLTTAYNDMGEPLSSELIDRLDRIFESSSLHNELAHALRQLRKKAYRQQ